MNFGSLFSGIGGFDLGFKRAGMECAWQVEIDKKCQDVLRRQLPGAEIYSDVKKVHGIYRDQFIKSRGLVEREIPNTEHDSAGGFSPVERDIGDRNNGHETILPSVDVICGGFPCQDLSVAGRRAGLAGERSGLWYEFHRILAEVRPGWVVIENVPGLLSSNGGRDFAVILQGLVKLGYGVCWRILDAQYFGVAQRRRRVFIVGHLGDGRAAQVLFEREGSSRDTSPSREAGKGIAPTLSGSANRTGGDRPPGTQVETAESLVVNAFNGYTGRADDNDAQGNHIVAIRSAQTGSNGWGVLQDGTVHTLDSTAGDVIAFNADRDGVDTFENISPTLTHKGDSKEAHGAYQKVAVAQQVQWASGGGQVLNDTAQSLRSGAEHNYQFLAWHNKQQSGEVRIQGETVNAVTQQWGTGGNNVPFVGVRRLTPVECERLQGFPDGWTDGQADSTRYRQLGNAVAVPCAEWIGRRIAT